MVDWSSKNSQPYEIESQIKRNVHKGHKIYIFSQPGRSEFISNID